MAQPDVTIEDLEDGEIGSDEEEEVVEVQPEEKREDSGPILEGLNQEQNNVDEIYHPKSGKKKKSKNRKSEQKQKNKKIKMLLNAVEEDFAAGIEKAIRKAMNKDEDDEEYHDEVKEGRKGRKRKKNGGKEGSGKKRKKKEYTDEMDETEMICVRGASPVQRHSPTDNYQDDDRDSYESDSSHELREPQQQQRPQRHRPQQRDRKNNNKNDRDRRRGAHPMQDPDGVCLYYMQGKCHKGDDCMYSHNAQPPRKMELCKFYLMECCAKRDKCLYMHADFPCKYYHTGLPCIYKDECKFAHGPPLNDNLKNILLKHIESAPKEILGDFPRLNREGAMKMIQNTQLKLMQQFSNASEGQDTEIPSLFDVNVQRPPNATDNMGMMNQFSNDKHMNNQMSPKVRQSRWQNDNSMPNYNSSLSPNYNTNSPNVLCIKNLTGVLTPRQISDLSKMGIENLDQLGQLTVMQLNCIGISLKQITEIQLNTTSIQKLGLLNANPEQAQQQHTYIPSLSGPKDLDLRVPPSIAVTNASSVTTELPEKDIDMRFQPAIAVPKNNILDQNINEVKPVNKDMIDIDQYTKDALKFASKDKENIDISNDKFESEKSSAELLPLETKDVDHRVLLPLSEEHARSTEVSFVKESDTDIRFLRPDPIFKSPDKRNRRSTTDDDDDNNLCIDEKWYSSDEEKGNKKEKCSPVQSPRFLSPPPTPAPHVIEPSSVLQKIGDLSKIDISEEVTKLLNTMKNNLHDHKVEVKEHIEETSKLRDPRERHSPEPKLELSKSSSKKKPKISIYECIDGEPTDGRRRSDVDLRQSDYKIPAFGDTDLRQSSSGDIDFRLGLPFKPIPNYTPASEIDGSINSHPPIPYKLVPIDIPRPDYTDIRNSTAKSQALVDPRLRKVFRLSIDDSNSDSEKPAKPVATGPRVDPRRKLKEPEPLIQDQKMPSLDLQLVIQNCDWYKELSSTHKIFVNQQIATVTAMIKMYQQDKTPGKKFDLPSIQSNTVLVGIFNNLGVTLGENGEFSYLPKPKEGLLKTPMAYNQSNNPFGMSSNMQGMDGSNMNMMSMQNMNMSGPMNNMPMGNMPGYNQPYPDPRGGLAPGLLGIAPNIPHNFNKFPAPGNFGNMPFNGPGNDFGIMEGEQNYQRFPNRGGHRGRGNERWHRGGNNRGGHRDRKNFNDRGNWKNDRQ